MSRTDTLPILEGDFKQWPDFWFQQLIRSERDGNQSEAEQALKELDRLGWIVKRKPKGR